MNLRIDIHFREGFCRNHYRLRAERAESLASETHRALHVAQTYFPRRIRDPDAQFYAGRPQSMGRQGLYAAGCHSYVPVIPASRKKQHGRKKHHNQPPEFSV